MSEIISICVGIVCIAISGDIGSMIHVNGLPIILDIIGGCFIAFGILVYQKKKEAEMGISEELLASINSLKDKTVSIEDFEDLFTKLENICNSQNNLLDKQDRLLELVTESVGTTKELEEKYILLGERQIESVSDLSKTALDIKKVSQDVALMADDYASKMQDNNEQIVAKFGYLSDDLEELERKRRKSFEDIMREIQSYNENNSDFISEKLLTLCEQFKEFKSVSEGLVEKMAAMAKDDYEMMKGILNG